MGVDKKKLKTAKLYVIPLVYFLNVKRSLSLKGKYINMYSVCASV